jgi:hypothetical protein
MRMVTLSRLEKWCIVFQIFSKKQDSEENFSETEEDYDGLIAAILWKARTGGRPTCPQWMRIRIQHFQQLLEGRSGP